MSNESPFEIILAPFTVWIAPVGSDFPEVGGIPDADNWAKMGTSGDKSINEDGVSVASGQVVNYIRTSGGTYPRKASRSEESLIVSFSLLDMKLEQIKHAFNSNAVQDTPADSGTKGFRTLLLGRGISVAQKSLLIRGESPYGEDFKADFQLPRLVHEGEPEIIGKKDEPQIVLMQFQAIDDDDKDIKLVIQDAVAT